jgi:hypothetical protein
MAAKPSLMFKKWEKKKSAAVELVYVSRVMVRFKNRYFVVEIIWDGALMDPCTRPPQDISRSIIQKALQVLILLQSVVCVGGVVASCTGLIACFRAVLWRM